MKTIILAAALALIASPASALTCKEDSTVRKLVGAALASHMKKCETDAKTKCEADSKLKKLFGAAFNSHMKKCVNDAVGS